MKQNTHTTTKKSSIKNINDASASNEAAYSTMGEDVKSSILVLSLIVNLYILTTWMVLQVTTQYDSQLYSFLFSR